jgi:hypothetical protein
MINKTIESTQDMFGIIAFELLACAFSTNCELAVYRLADVTRNSIR